MLPKHCMSSTVIMDVFHAGNQPMHYATSIPPWSSIFDLGLDLSLHIDLGLDLSHIPY